MPVAGRPCAAAQTGLSSLSIGSWAYAALQLQRGMTGEYRIETVRKICKHCPPEYNDNALLNENNLLHAYAYPLAAFVHIDRA
jgi:hypothetical protein